MPGHKGQAGGLFSEVSSIDMTELPPTGNLYTMEGPIPAAEDLCAQFAGAGDALFFTCGATQGIYTMIAQAVGMGNALILDRGCHKSVYQAMALLDVTPHYIYPAPLSNTQLSGPVTPEALDRALSQWPDAKAVLLTSPSYYGVMSDLTALARLCHEKGKFLLVDQAHGAHFPAVGLASAAAQGADLSVVSTHKTWPALGASSILYIGTGSGFEKKALKETSALFGTTSPSYPILASIDYAREALEGEDGAQYRACAARTRALREKINKTTPFTALTEAEGCALDPCRLTIDTLSGGLPGDQADSLLRAQNIYVEMSDSRYLVMILTCRDGQQVFDRLYEGLLSLVPACIPQKSAGEFLFPPQPIPRLSLRSALFGPKGQTPLAKAAGEISAALVCPYPPGVPVLAPGEEITQKHIAYLQKKRYNIEEMVSVVTADSHS